MFKNNFETISISYRNITFYKEKGYDAKLHQNLTVLSTDINPNSHLRFDFICQSCGKTVNLSVEKYYDNISRCGFYGCRACSEVKRKITNLATFGYDNPSKSPEVRKRTEETNMKLYGYKCNFQDPKCQEKIKKTCLERYGKETPLGSQHVMDLAKKANLEKYGVEHYTQTDDYLKDQYVRWVKLAHERMKLYGFTDYELFEDRTLKVKCDAGQDHYFIIDTKNLKQRHVDQKTICCTICNPLIHDKISAAQLEIINNLNDNELSINDREQIKPYELDIYVHKFKLAIEYNGIYYHSTKRQEDNEYHHKKLLNCFNKEIDLLQIFEYTSKNKKEQTFSLLNNKLLKNTKIYGRNCEIKEIDDCNEFILKNSIYENFNFNESIGLYYNEELVYLINLNIDEYNNCEIVNIISKLNTTIVGGFSKLLKLIKNEYSNIWIEHNLDLGFTELFKNNGFILADTYIKSKIYQDKTYKEILVEEPNCFVIYNAGYQKWILI